MYARCLILVFYFDSKLALIFFRNTWLAEYEGEIVIKGDHISDYAWKVYLLNIHIHLQYVHAYMYSKVCKACSNLVEHGDNSCR